MYVDVSLPLPAVRRPLRILAAGAAVGLVLAGTCLCAAGLWRRAVAGAVASAVDRAGARLGLQVDVSSQRVEGLGTVVLEGVALGRDRRTEPLLTAGLVRVRPGLSLRRGPYPAVVEVEEPTLRLGPDLARLVERVRAPASGGAGAGERAARPLPRIAVRAAQVVVEGRQGPVETWEVPLATVAPGERGALLGAVELRAGPDMPRFLALGGHVGQAGYALELEAAAPVRPAALTN